MKTYTKEQVESIIKEIIHQDSFGDVHWHASKVAEREGFDLSKEDVEKDN